MKFNRTNKPDLSDATLRAFVADCEQRGPRRLGPIDVSLYWICREILSLRKKVTKRRVK